MKCWTISLLRSGGLVRSRYRKLGIPVPFDEKHVIYVWPDALSNYISALGCCRRRYKFQKYWPADVHLVGQEIIRFHTIIWPIMLKAAGLTAAKKVFGHGWPDLDGGKMRANLRGQHGRPSIALR